MDGVINVYKEAGMTSFAVVAALRPVLKTKRIGHTGTLDPDATGVLPVCVGRATKLVELLEHTDKTYRAVMLLGVSTDTQDLSGTVTAQVPEKDIEKILSGNADLRKQAVSDYMETVIRSFTGQISQVPPMYSALKVGGVKLVDAARKGQVVNRPARIRTIYEFRDISVSSDFREVSFTVRCSKGTYIRTLCEDIGKAFALPACLKKLERLQASGLDSKDAVVLSHIRQLALEGRLAEILIPVDHFLEEYEALTVNEQGRLRLLSGNFLRAQDLNGEMPGEGSYRIYDEQGVFYALYKYDCEKGCLKAEKMFLPKKNK